MPVPVQTTRHITPLRRAFGLFGGLRLKLDETVVPVAVVEDLVAEDWRNAFSAYNGGASGAGNRHHFQMSNPAGSGVLIELFSVRYGCTVTQEFRFTVDAVPYVPGTILGRVFQDLDGLYSVPTRIPIGEFRWAAAAAALLGTEVNSGLTNVQANGLWEPRVILHPGQAINWATEIVNTEINMGVQWRERPLLPTER